MARRRNPETPTESPPAGAELAPTSAGEDRPIDWVAEVGKVEAAPRIKRNPNNKVHSLNKASVLRADERARVATMLRAQGADYEQIRKHLGLKHRTTVGKLLSRELRNVSRVDPNTEHLRRLQLVQIDERERRMRAELDQARKIEDPKARVAAHAAIEAAIAKQHEQRARLLGTNASVDVKVVLEAEHRAAIDRLRALFEGHECAHCGKALDTYKQILGAFVTDEVGGVLKRDAERVH
jgi:hypothetical protein